MGVVVGPGAVARLRRAGSDAYADRMRAATMRPPHLLELGGFLRRRRGAISPEHVGIARDTQQRRVDGLRREEVAQLAHISVDYYTRIEQGRLAPTAPVLDDLASALALTGDDLDYMHSLLEHARERGQAKVHRASPQLRAMLDQLPNTPALILGPRTEILGWNRLAALLYVDFDTLPTEQLNYTWLTYRNPGMCALFGDWDSVARSCIALLRRESASSPRDEALLALIAELSATTDSFARMWEERVVDRQDSGRKKMHHPLVGDLDLAWNMFRAAAEPAQQLLLYSADAGSESARRLQLLHTA